MEKDAHFGDRPLVPQAPSFFSCAPFASCHIPLSLNDPIVQWPRTLPFHGSNTGSNPVRVAGNPEAILNKRVASACASMGETDAGNARLVVLVT